MLCTLESDMKGLTVICMPLPVCDLSKDQGPLHFPQHYHTSLGSTSFPCRIILHNSYTSFRRKDGKAAEVHGASSRPSSDFLYYPALSCLFQLSLYYSRATSHYRWRFSRWNDVVSTSFENRIASPWRLETRLFPSELSPFPA